MSPIQILGAILGNTPTWVFAVFALLVFMGVQFLRARTLPLRRVFITPAVFITWGIVSLAIKPNFSALLIADWLAAAALGASIALLLVRFHDLRVDRERRRVRLPGSVQPLVRNVVIFVTKYALAVAMAMTPAAREHLAFWDVAVSGLAAGYFLGWVRPPGRRLSPRAGSRSRLRAGAGGLVMSTGAMTNSSEPVVRMADVIKVYDDDGLAVKAIDRITLTIQPRQFTMIVGPSGSGKTTLLNLMGCIDTASEGMVEVCGEEVATLERRRRFGFPRREDRLHLPELQPGSGPHRLRERRIPPAAARPPGQGAARAHHGGARPPSVSPSTRIIGPTSCRAGSASASPSPAPWSRSRRSCSPTSRPPISTATPAPRSSS